MKQRAMGGCSIVITLNELYLTYLLKIYTVQSVDLFDYGFTSYILSTKRDSMYLILCNHYNDSMEVDTVLQRISKFDETLAKGTSYLCIMSAKNPASESCTHCNGKSFVHFVFFDNITNVLKYDKKFYYFGSKLIKKAIDIFVSCFCEGALNEQREKNFS